MIFFALWKSGLLGRTDREKFLFFLGLTDSPTYLSRRWPLVRSINWGKALFLPSYANAVVAWLNYRAQLYDGFSG